MNLDTTGLFLPQIPHAEVLLSSVYLNGIACDHSETGIGKTYVAAWIAKQAGFPVVVIGPKNALRMWKEVLAKYGVKPAVMVGYEILMRGHTPHLGYRKPDIDPKTGTAKQRWRYQLVDSKFPAGALIIIDEAHKCKGTSSLNAGLLIDLKRKGYKLLLLSATMATSVLEMKAFGYATNLHNLYHWRDWCIENGAMEDERFNLTFEKDDLDARKKMSGCHVSLFETQRISSRLTREDMGSLFPDNHITADAYDLGANSSKIQAVYDEMEEEIAKLEEGTAEYSSHVFAEIIKARRKAEMLKIPLIHEMFEDFYDEGKSVVVFLNFTESINALGDRLEKSKRFQDKIGYVYGEASLKSRLTDIDLFQADKKRGLICNLKAGGASLSYHDLHGNHPRASIINPSFSAIDMLQALGRICRQGGKSKAFQRILYAAGCIEEHCCRRVQMRLDNLHYLNEDCLSDDDLQGGLSFFNN